MKKISCIAAPMSILFSLSLHAKVHEIKTVDEYNELMKQGKPAAVDVSATWCGPCKQIKPFFEELSEQSMYQEILFIGIDGDNQPTKALVNKLGVQGYPTFIFFNAGGQEVGKFSGANRDLLQRNIEKIAGKKCPAPAMMPMKEAPMMHEMPQKKQKKMMEEEQPKKIKKKGRAVKITTSEEFISTIIQSDKHTVIHFKAPDCPQCNDLEQAINKLAHDKEYDSLQFVTIDTHNKELKNIIGGEGLLALPSYTWLFKGMTELKNVKTEEALDLKIRLKLMDAYGIPAAID